MSPELESKMKNRSTLGMRYLIWQVRTNDDSLTIGNLFSIHKNLSSFVNSAGLVLFCKVTFFWMVYNDTGHIDTGVRIP